MALYSMAGTIENIFSLRDKVAIVTGTSRGNGQVIAEAFLGAGAIVYCAQRKLDRGVGRHTDLRAQYVRVDVTEKGDLVRLVRRVYREQERIDILVNNAAISISGPSERYTEKDWEKTYVTNLKSAFVLSQLVARHMIAQRSGVIINITSIGAEQGFPNNPAYGAFKGGLKQLSKAFANDWGKYNIRVNNVGLGYFRTDMTRKSWDDVRPRRERTRKILLGRWGEARDLVGPILFIASDAAAYMTGQDLYIDGGWLAKGL